MWRMVLRNRTVKLKAAGQINRCSAHEYKGHRGIADIFRLISILLVFSVLHTTCFKANSLTQTNYVFFSMQFFCMKIPP